MENLLAKHDRYSGFPLLINQMGLRRGLELGTREGFFADHLLSTTNLDILYSIDRDIDSPNLKVVKEKHGDRFKVVAGHSPGISSIFPDKYFDFIYIDAGHTYDDVYADLRAWWPKLKSNGGLFAGDDWMPANTVENGIHPEGPFDVCTCVQEWAIENNIEYYITGTEAKSYKDKYDYGMGMWKLLRDRIHEGHKTFQIPQWWAIKNK